MREPKCEQGPEEETEEEVDQSASEGDSMEPVQSQAPLTHQPPEFHMEVPESPQDGPRAPVPGSADRLETGG